MAKDFYGKAVFVEVDVDEMSEIAEPFGIKNMPTFKFVKGGEEVDTLEGPSKGKLLDLVNKHL